MFEIDYAKIVADILVEGEVRRGRNGETKSTFVQTLQFDLKDGFPLLNGRKIFYKGVLGELAAMLRGPKELADFERFNCNYWKQWAEDDGKLNVDYGNSWLNFGGANQLRDLVKGLRTDPTGRRHIITGWNPANLPTLSLPCCHLLYQWYVRDTGELDMMWYQRSADWMVGVPSDAVLAAAWNIILANEVGYIPGKVTMVFGDAHIYAEHYDGADIYLEQLANNTMGVVSPKWRLELPLGVPHPLFMPEQLVIHNYCPAPTIKFEVKA